MKFYDAKLEIDDKTLEEIAERIKPVARFKIENNTLIQDEEGDLFYVKTPHDLRGVGVNRQAKAVKPVYDLTELKRITTYHTLSSMLNASVAEVLAQIPEEDLEKTVAFEVTHDFPCNWVSEGLKSYHETITILYEKKQ